MEKCKVKINYFIAISILVSVSMIVTGISIMQTVFPSTIPYSGRTRCNIPFTCYSSKYGEYSNVFVEGYYYDCYLVLPEDALNYVDMFCNVTFDLSSGIYVEDMYPLDFDTEKEMYYLPIYNMSKNIDGITLKYYVNWSEYNGSYPIPYSNTDSFDIKTKNRVFTREEYHKREFEKLSYLVGILSVSLFSVFSAMHNIVNLFQKK